MTRQERMSNTKLRPYVVCIDSRWIRNAEVLDPPASDENDINPEDLPDDRQEWEPLEYNAFLDIITAESEREARHIAGQKHGFDHRLLFAIPICCK